MSDDAGDCPTCGAAGSVLRGYCQVCYAEVEESGGRRPSPGGPRAERSTAPGIPLGQPNRPVT